MSGPFKADQPTGPTEVLKGPKGVRGHVNLQGAAIVSNKNGTTQLKGREGRATTARIKVSFPFS